MKILFTIAVIAMILFAPRTKAEVTPSVKVEKVGQHSGGFEQPDFSSPAGGVEKKAVIREVTKIVPKSDIEALICQYFTDNCDVAIAVARCESGLRDHAVGDHAIAYIQDGVEYGKSYGVFQIRSLPGRPEPEKLLDPSFNVQYAYNLYKRSGFTPWSAYTNDCYLAFLK